VADFRGTETILLVEDKPQIRHIIQTGLRARGYTVLVATGAAEALALYKMDPVSIQLLLTDVVMPRDALSGSDLSKELTARRPTLKTLYISAHPDWMLEDEGILTLGVPFIQSRSTKRIWRGRCGRFWTRGRLIPTKARQIEARTARPVGRPPTLALGDLLGATLSDVVLDRRF
jgi:CheY-like chemotaxis protein